MIQYFYACILSTNVFIKTDLYDLSEQRTESYLQ